MGTTVQEPIYLDSSTLDAVASCSTEAVIRYILDYTTREERAELKSGQVLHEVLAHWFSGASKETCLKGFGEEYQDWAKENAEPDSRFEFENVNSILSSWLDTHPVQSFPFRVRRECVEQPFSYPLDDNGEFFWCGRIDLVCDDLRDNFLYVCDHKTTGRVNHYWARKFRLLSQITGYVWAAQKMLEERGEGGNVVGAYINAIELSKLPSDTSRKCKEHGVVYAECGPLHAKSQLLGPFMRTPEQIETWRQNAIQLARRYRQLFYGYNDVNRLHRVQMEGSFHNACAFCQFYEFCAQGRPIERIGSYFQYEPWEPYEGAFQHKERR